MLPNYFSSIGGKNLCCILIRGLLCACVLSGVQWKFCLKKVPLCAFIFRRRIAFGKCIIHMMLRMQRSLKLVVLYLCIQYTCSRVYMFCIAILQGWDFAHSLICPLLFCSKSLILESDCERFAHVTLNEYLTCFDFLYSVLAYLSLSVHVLFF